MSTGMKRDCALLGDPPRAVVLSVALDGWHATGRVDVAYLAGDGAADVLEHGYRQLERAIEQGRPGRQDT